jgi:hypothetical protein
MPRLQPKYNFGVEEKNENPELYNQLSDLYHSIAQIVNTKSSKNVTNQDPPANQQVNLNYDIGDIWVNQSTNMSWIMTSRTTNLDVVWTLIT